MQRFVNQFIFHAAISEIQVDRETRQRRVIDTADLLPSIRARGVMVPIILRQGEDKLPWLVAGERRLETCRQLGMETIPAIYTANLNPLQLQIVELEENLKRQDLTWQERARALERVHELYLQENPQWTITASAEALGYNLGNLSLILAVAKEMKDEKISGAGGVREAWNILQRRQKRAAGDALYELIDDGVAQARVEAEAEAQGEVSVQFPGTSPGTLAPAPRPLPPAPSEPILETSFLNWAPNYSGQQFNFIHCDFPYGVKLFDGPQGRGAEGGEGYDDSPEIYWELLKCLCTHRHKLMSVSSHLMFWLSAEDRIVRETLEFFWKHAPELQFYKFRLVWMKSDNAGIASDPQHWPRHIYETALLASMGRRPLVQVVADAYSAPSDRTLHPSTKPEPMLRHFFRALVGPDSRVLDPTCGSGAALRAAESLGAASILGLELDPEHCRVAKQALRSFRALRTL